MIADHPPLALRPLNMIYALPERNGAARTNAGTGRTQALASSVGTEIAFYRMMATRVVAHSAIWTGRYAFTTASALILVNGNNAIFGIF